MLKGLLIFCLNCFLVGFFFSRLDSHFIQVNKRSLARLN